MFAPKRAASTPSWLIAAATSAVPTAQQPVQKTPVSVASDFGMFTTPPAGTSRVFLLPFSDLKKEADDSYYASTLMLNE